MKSLQRNLINKHSTSPCAQRQKKRFRCRVANTSLASHDAKRFGFFCGTRTLCEENAFHRGEWIWRRIESNLWPNWIVQQLSSYVYRNCASRGKSMKFGALVVKGITKRFGYSAIMNIQHGANGCHFWIRIKYESGFRQRLQWERVNDYESAPRLTAHMVLVLWTLAALAMFIFLWKKMNFLGGY